MHYIMTKLGFICNWHPAFGYLNYERDHIDYFKKKKFVVYICDMTEDEVVCLDSIFADFYNIVKPFLIKEYVYKDRLFCNLNYSFYNFVKKCKHYYKKKIENYKHPKNILHRQQFGKFIML